MMAESLFIEMSILKKYTPRNCRLGATSKESQLIIDIAETLKQGCWKNVKTFFNFHKKDIVYYASGDIDFMSILT